MISLDHAKRSDRLMRATTSLTGSEFDELVGRFAVAWVAVRAAKTAAGAARQRRPGGGPKSCLVSAEQKRFYSGRKKRHAVQNVIIVGERKVLWCSPTVPAKCHDKKVAERARLRLAEEIHLLGDSQFNRLLAADRIQVEHTLASVKRLRILRDEFRNRRQGMIDEVYVLPNSTGPRPPRAMLKRAEVSRAKA